MYLLYADMLVSLHVTAGPSVYYNLKGDFAKLLYHAAFVCAMSLLYGPY